MFFAEDKAAAISIHALRVEGDHCKPVSIFPGQISIHALRVEGDCHVTLTLKHLLGFLSTPSGWRATSKFNGLLKSEVISIHALRVEGDPCTLF